MMRLQFEDVERQDVQVVFHDQRSSKALHELRSIPGTRRVEPQLAVPVRLEKGPRSRMAAIVGLSEDQLLLGLRDRAGFEVPLPRRGLLLSRALADLLGAVPGDVLRARVLVGERQRLDLPLESVVDDYLGVQAYADLDRLSHWIGEERLMTGAALLVDPDRQAELGRELKRLPAVSAVVFKGHTVANFKDTLGRSQGVMTAMVSLFAGIIAFGVIFNASRIGLAERQRELAALQVMGYRPREVSGILSGENLLLGVLALPPGIGLGWIWAQLLARFYESDLYRWPLEISPAAVAQTALIILAFIVVTNLAVRRRLRHLDPVTVLKAPE